MLKELFVSWFSDNKVKITSPVLGTFIGAWVIFNWKNFLLLFWGEGKLEERLAVFDAALSFSNCNMWLWPLLVALVYAFGLPYLNVASHKLRKHAEEWRYNEVVDIDIVKTQKKAALNEEIYKADPANPYLGRKLEAELKQKEADAEKARADADKAEAERKEAVARQEAAEAETREAKAKEAEAIRKEEREHQAHELSKAKHKQDVANHQFPTLYLFINLLSNSLKDNEICLPINLLSEAIAKCFGYNDFDSMLSDDTFTISELDELACVVYDDTLLLSDLKELIKKHQANIEEGELFDYLVMMFEEVDKFSFIPTSSMEDVAKNFLDDTSNIFDLVHDDAVNDQINESGANSFGPENTEFIDIDMNQNGEFVVNAAAEVVGEAPGDRPFSGLTINVNFQLIYKPIIGKNGFSKPVIEDVSASLNRDW